MPTPVPTIDRAARATIEPPAIGPTPPPVVKLDGVGHRFGNVDALVDLTFVVPGERITVLLGPNGAGKTTAIRVITGALTPKSGEVRTFGLDPNTDGVSVRRRCGVVSAKPALYDRLSGWDNLRYSAELHQIADMERRIREAAGRFGIADALDQQVGGYSTGMKTRLTLARSVLHDPQLLLFDEPTSGLDPESAAAVLHLVREMTGDGHTVVMCTHLLPEAEGLADHVVVLEKGTAVMTGVPDELTRIYWPEPVVRFAAEDPESLDILLGVEGVTSFARNGWATVTVDNVDRVAGLVAYLVHSGVKVTRVEPHIPTLEDLYFAVRRDRS